jgi:hypothetical protein
MGHCQALARSAQCKRARLPSLIEIKQSVVFVRASRRCHESPDGLGEWLYLAGIGVKRLRVVERELVSSEVTSSQGWHEGPDLGWSYPADDGVEWV